jgi:hypothetical protein
MRLNERVHALGHHHELMDGNPPAIPGLVTGVTSASAKQCKGWIVRRLLFPPLDRPEGLHQFIVFAASRMIGLTAIGTNTFTQPHGQHA